jgi:dihydroorotase
MMLTHWKEGRIGIERIVEKMCHAPADCFQIAGRGYLEEGYFADIVQLNTWMDVNVTKENILYQCGWSPLENQTLPGRIEGTWVNGVRLFDHGVITGVPSGKRLTFNP